jgi:hypothetical protein
MAWLREHIQPRSQVRTHGLLTITGGLSPPYLQYLTDKYLRSMSWARPQRGRWANSNDVAFLHERLASAAVILPSSRIWG